MNLAEKYSRDKYLVFLEGFLPDFSKNTRDFHHGGSVFNNVKYLGECPSMDLQILEVEVNGNLDKRISITRNGFKLLKDLAAYRALIVFHTKENDEWRLSLMTAQPTINDGKIVTKFSNPRRFSYLLGPEAKVNTPKKYLINKRIKDYEDLLNTFSIEVVNKEFYQQIARFFYKLVGGEIKVSSRVEQFTRTLKLPGNPGQNKVYQEFAVRLIGRIIFCWFLKQKKSKAGTPLLPETLLSSTAVRNESGYYHRVVEKIFFEALNKEHSERIFGVKDNSQFNLIPFLNGGLFDPHEDDHYHNGEFNGALSIPDEWFHELFEVLETYNFTIDENTITDVDLSVDPEMLGRIFENLLAEVNPETGESARKSTGSYYTPRLIVEYMVDQSLTQFLLNKTSITEDKIKALVSTDELDDESSPLTADEKETIINALDEIKIIDPACGSGAFPIGILQKIIMMLQRIDPEAKLWFARKTRDLDPVLSDGLKKRLEKDNFDYIRKNGVIKDSIYGVDIQAIAVEVSKLRCFLTLIVDEEIDENEDNRGIVPLPNLEFKFVAANTLIELPEANTSQAGLFEDHEQIQRLKKVRDAYFVSHGTAKANLKAEFYKVKNLMSQSQIDKAGQGLLTMALAKWDPFLFTSSKWFDSEWMFGVSSFDIVIANPPYVDSETMVIHNPEEREIYTKRFESAKGNWDLFIIFIERGLRLLQKDGTISYIVPNKLIAAKYSEKLREMLLEKQIAVLRDYSEVPVFKDVNVYPLVFVINNKKMANNPTVTYMKTIETPKYENAIDGNIFYRDIYWDKYFVPDRVLRIILKMSNNETLGSIMPKVESPATVGEAYEIKKFIKELADESLGNYKKLVNTGTIDPYICLWGEKKTQYIKDGYMHPVISIDDIAKISNNRLSQTNSPKIIIGGMSNRIEAYVDEDGTCLAGKSTTIILPGNFELKLLAAILNSQAVTFWYRIYFSSLSLAGGYLQVSPRTISQIPLPSAGPDDSRQLVQLVDKIIEAKDKAIIDNLVHDIDLVVNRLYGLTSEEISIVNGEEPVS